MIALLPSGGNETGEGIHKQHLKIQKMAAHLSLPIVALTADGAASELAAQALMDEEQSEEPPLVYEYPLYGILLRAPVFKKTGPLISVTDPPHARKTCRNQPQYGTHTASLGVGFLVNHSFVDLYVTGKSGLVIRDVDNVDKQDDGAARRMFHSQTLSAAADLTDSNNFKIRPGCEGVFVYLFVMGKYRPSYVSRRNFH